MPFIDAHTHSFLRGPEDLESMALAGVEALVVCAFLPVQPSEASGLIDSFRWLDTVERARLAERGLAMRLAVGVHPRCIPERGLEKALEAVDRMLGSGAAVALGEVGLETGSQAERDAFAQQLRIARAKDRPVVVHTPRKEKAARLDQIVAIIQAEKVDPGLVVLDHLTPELVPVADRLGTWAGITLQPGKVSPDELSVLLRARGPDRLLVDSDLSHAPSDPLTLPKAARHLWRDGHSAEAIERVTHHNAATVFRLHSINEGS